MIFPRQRFGSITGLFLVLGLVTTQLEAHDFTYETNNGAITVTGYIGSGEIAFMPGMIHGLPVTGIANGAFAQCTNLARLKIPNSITNVPPNALQGYIGLIEVYKPSPIGSQETFAPRTKLWTERVMLPLATGKWGQTQVLFWHTNALGPWAQGNSMFFEADSAELEGRNPGMTDSVLWRISNMHAENFHEITARLGLSFVEAEVVHRRLVRTVSFPPFPEIVRMQDEGDCVITDPRIPKEWLLSSPGDGHPKSYSQYLLSIYPDNFEPTK